MIPPIDLLLATALPLIAWRVLATDELPTSVVLFIAFGLLSALAWARLDAPDVALVEAAVGTGLTGALLMSSLRSMERPRPPSPWRARAIALVAAAIAVALASVVALLPRGALGLGPAVLARSEESGVAQPVTAVLMNFRGHDTHLEMLVLLAASIGVLSIQHGTASHGVDTAPTSSVVMMLVELIVPALVVLAGYLVWRGSRAPGGAFQAGAILAGGAVLLLLTRRMAPLSLERQMVRMFLFAGPVLFFLVAAVPLGFGGDMLEYPRGWGGSLILGLESALTLSIATILTMFFPQGAPAPRRRG